MSGVSARLITAIVRTLPARTRDRYREEWLADLDGAAEADVSPTEIVTGALMTAITIDRLAPESTGLTLGSLFAHRLRVALAFLGAAAIPAVGFSLYGGYEGFGPVVSVTATVLLVASVALTVVGLVALGAAIRVAIVARRPIVTGALLAGPLLLIALLVVAPSVVLSLAVLASPMLVITVAVLVILSSRGIQTMPLSTRVVLAAAFATVALVVCAAGIVHTMVWNPLERVPGLSLDEIYTRLAAAGEATGTTVWIIAWAVVTVIGAAALITMASLTRGGSTRRLVASGFLLIAATTAIGILPGFSMGMGLADTFMTSGGDAAASGPLLAMIGQLALVASILVAFVRDPLSATPAADAGPSSAVSRPSRSDATRPSASPAPSSPHP